MGRGSGLVVVDFYLKSVDSEGIGDFVTSHLAALKTNSSALILAHMTNLNGKIRITTGHFLKPGDYIVKFVPVVVVQNNPPANVFVGFSLLW